ncbi:4-(cytidine 5'-diphospho)-2-C-methyl-D-erythritol kinase [Fluviibacter phosphoraccumulans]|uniref:4-(cytidine 5'-diphospho)-2-C-methyl-D-erythritol kinase n=1 Tax=Fluviibacter phosphoraccumulans TaxID=1751046 RepID=UPI003D6BC16D
MSFKTPAPLPDPQQAMRWNWSTRYPAPAKLNLFLHVTGQRVDGYHTLQTLFRFVALYDTLRFVPRSDDRVVLANPIPGVAPETDLTVRAAEALRRAAGIRDGVTIHLLKRLPMGGGLGGGSSDAATVLLALNYLWRLGASQAELQALALPLGADVPIFVFGQSAFAEGVGEALSPVALPPAWYLILHPGVAVPTARIFTAPDLTRDTPPIEARAWADAMVRGVGTNDLEAVAVALYPEVGVALDWLRAQPETTGRIRMTGSGACVFAVFDDEQTAQAVQQRLPAAWQGWVCAGLDQHPLHELIPV